MTRVSQISQMSQSLHKALRPLLFYGKLLGLVNFHFTNPGYQTSIVCMVYSVIVLLIFVPLSVYGMVLRAKLEANSLMATTTDIMLSAGTCIQTIIAILCSVAFSKKYISMLSKIVDTDRKFKELGVWICYDNLFKSVIRRLVLHTLLIVASTSLYIKIFVYMLSPELILYNLTSLLSSIINVIIVEQVATYVLILKDRFKILNDHLQDLQKQIPDKDELSNIKLTSPLTTKIKMLRTICPLHHELTKVGKIINEVFGLQLLVTFGVIFVSITIGLYYVCSYIQQQIDNKWENTVGSFLIALNYIIDTLILCYACHSTVEEANNSGRLLHQIEYTDDDVKDQIEMFSLQIVNEDLRFSAVGFFPVDYTLIFSIIGGITTYLIILIQFSSGSTNATS